MLFTAYVPLIKEYFPEANGNWDAAIMDTRAPLLNTPKYTNGTLSNPGIAAVLAGVRLPSATGLYGKTFKVPPGGIIQQALDSCANTGGLVVL